MEVDEDTINESNNYIEGMEDEFDWLALKWYSFTQEMKGEGVRMEMRETQIQEEEERCLQIHHVRRMRDNIKK